MLYFAYQRDAATAPNVGDRVPYVIVKAAKGAKVICFLVSWFGNCVAWFSTNLSCLFDNKQAYERSEDPIYVLENNIPIDPQYYLENQISKVSFSVCRLCFCSMLSSIILFMLFMLFKLFYQFPSLTNNKCQTIISFYQITVSVNFQPLLRIFEPILKNASKELLQGDHTRSISISTPSSGGIMKFAKKKLSCIGCKALIR